jgi:eukaryotic-like serine/threonine-protein kinase
MSRKTDTPPKPEDGAANAAEVPETLLRLGQPTLGLEGAAEDAPDDGLPRLEPGEQLAQRFTVLRFIARGGMGAVYEANDALLRTRVVLKVLRGRLVANADVLECFRREVLLARRVSHPSVCRVDELYQSTPASGAPCHFLTMEVGPVVSRRGRRSPLVRSKCATA